jgi:hypothetical protein
MFISYFDESGDDGYPKFSSELFVLTSVYMHYSKWKQNFEKVHQFRKQLKLSSGLKVNEEFHTKEFITDKDPYHGRFSPQARRQVLFDFFNLLPSLDIKIINVVIDKTNIKRPAYDVLKNALTYNVQRIENDLTFFGDAGKFMMITDEGRLGKMRDTVRKMQKINYIPSNFEYGKSYRKEIINLIEDPLPKNSNQSYFVQLADMLAFVVSLYAKRHLCPQSIDWGKRIKNVLQYNDEIELLEIAKPKLNLKASRYNKFGVVHYPK